MAQVLYTPGPIDGQGYMELRPNDNYSKEHIVFERLCFVVELEEKGHHVITSSTLHVELRPCINSQR